MWILLGVLACEEHHAQPHVEAHHTPAHDPAHDPEHAPQVQAQAPLSLGLNAGAKWALDAHTREVLAESRGTLQTIPEVKALAEAQTVSEAEARIAALQGYVVEVERAFE